MNEAIKRLTSSIQDAGGRALIVGGAVRDTILECEPKDFDLEVFGLDTNALESALSSYTTMRVGSAWPVFKVKIKSLTEPVDVSIARRPDCKDGAVVGFTPDPHASPGDAARCRDLTINAIMWDPSTGGWVDPCGGRSDLELKCFKAADLSTFLADPLRVLRTARFKARLGFELDDALFELMKQADLTTLPKERIGGEWQRILACAQPSVALKLLRDVGQLDHVPELKALIDVPQDPIWHPEGCVWTHTLHVVDAAARIAEREGLEGDERWVLMLAALCHDLGKATTTVQRNNRWSAPGHAAAGGPLAEALLERLDVPTRIGRLVLPLVQEHMSHLHIQPQPRDVRRLARRLGPATVRVWGWLVEADHSGRPPLVPGAPGQMIVGLAQRMALADQAPVPLLLGRHLIAVGLKPGPRFHGLLTLAFQAQLDGHFDSVEGGLHFLRDSGEIGRA